MDALAASVKQLSWVCPRTAAVNIPSGHTQQQHLSSSEQLQAPTSLQVSPHDESQPTSQPDRDLADELHNDAPDHCDQQEQPPWQQPQQPQQQQPPWQQPPWQQQQQQQQQQLLQQPQQQQPPQQQQMGPSRAVHCCDAITWLEQQPVLEGCSFITSLPDVSELIDAHGQVTHDTLATWRVWFIKAAQLILSRCPDNGVAIFFQTDIKFAGTWVDKAYLVQRAAEDTGHNLLWHKVVCRVPAGAISCGRPGYHHMLCLSKGVRAEPARSTSDVLQSPGSKTWARGMGTVACAAACRFVLQQTATRTIVDPFCGHGTVLAAANAMGLDAVGVECSHRRVKQAERLTMDQGLQLDRWNNKGGGRHTQGQQQAQHGLGQQQGEQQQEEAQRVIHHIEQLAPADAAAAAVVLAE